MCPRLLVNSGVAYCSFVDGLHEIGDENGSDVLVKTLDELQCSIENRVKLYVFRRNNMPGYSLRAIA